MKKFKPEEAGLALLVDKINNKGVKVASKELIEEILSKNIDGIVGYIRTACEDQYGIAIRNQKEEILEFCKKYNINCKELFIDNGYSGLNFNRPGIKKITENSKYKVVLVKDLSRFSRDYIGTSKYIEDNKKIILSIIDSSIWR